MNNIRRSSIRSLIDKLEHYRTQFEKIRDEEQEYYDRIPENLQGSYRADESLDAIECLDNVIENLTDAIDNAEESME